MSPAPRLAAPVNAAASAHCVSNRSLACCCTVHDPHYHTTFCTLHTTLHFAREVNAWCGSQPQLVRCSMKQTVCYDGLRCLHTLHAVLRTSADCLKPHQGIASWQRRADRTGQQRAWCACGHMRNSSNRPSAHGPRGACNACHSIVTRSFISGTRKISETTRVLEKKSPGVPVATCPTSPTARVPETKIKNQKQNEINPHLACLWPRAPPLRPQTKHNHEQNKGKPHLACL